MKKNKLIICALVIVFVLVIVISIKAIGGEKHSFCLEDSYKIYKENFMSKDGRIIDYERGSITTSEGQSYMMLRSLIMDDKKTFDLVYKWSKDNLQREDKLFAWLWGKSGSEYKILDQNSASDADVDIAFALLLAYQIYADESYLQEALPIIQSIWDKEVKRVNNFLVLMPGVEQALHDRIEVNPSYFSTYAFKLFQKYDDLHDWFLLVDSSYYYLEKASMATSTGLYPDWFFIEDGNVVLDESSRSDFSYDAIRVFPRALLDYENTRDKRAFSVMKKSAFLLNKYKNSNVLYTNYKADGSLRNRDRFVGGIALLLPVFKLFDKKEALSIYNNEVMSSIESETYWSDKSNYYGKNLAWFGLYWFQSSIQNCKINKR